MPAQATESDNLRATTTAPTLLINRAESAICAVRQPLLLQAAWERCSVLHSRGRIRRSGCSKNFVRPMRSHPRGKKESAFLSFRKPEGLSTGAKIPLSADFRAGCSAQSCRVTAVAADR